MRWRVEGFFSSFKRISGEGVQATSRERMFREIRMKVDSYNMLIDLAVCPEVNGGRQPPWKLCNKACN